MKQRLLHWMQKIDALSLRERLMVFAAVIASLVGLVNLFALQPMEVRQKRLSQQLKTDQQQVSALSDEIAAKLRASGVDPDAQGTLRLSQVRQELNRLQSHLREQQKGLVSADKMIPLLQTLLTSHANVQLRSMKTLPLVNLQSANAKAAPTVAAVEPAAAAAGSANATGKDSAKGPLAEEANLKEKGLNPASAPKPSQADSSLSNVADKVAGFVAGGDAKPVASPSTAATLDSGAQLYKHEVQLVLVGNYLDLLRFLQALEKSPAQLYWGKASLRTEKYPQSSLTLHIYTLSLDQKWLDL